MESASPLTKSGRYSASLQLSCIRRFRPPPLFRAGTPSMVGWWGWRKRATTRWHLWSARLRQRPKAKEPSPEPASTTDVPAERDAVHSLAALPNGDHALERASAEMRVDREGARGPSPQFDRMTKGACALQYGWAGLRAGLTSRRAAPLPKAPLRKAPSRKAPLPKAPLPKAPLQPGRPHGPAAAHARCVRHTHIDIRVPDCVQLPCVDIHVPDTV